MSPERTAVVWRCMDFTKFVDRIDTNALFFPRADHGMANMESFFVQSDVTGRTA
jgi:hypothetical protein